MKKLLTTFLISSALTISSAIACDDCPVETGLKIASSAEQSSSAGTPAKGSLKKHKKTKKQRKHKHHDHEHPHDEGKNEHHEHKNSDSHSASVDAPASGN